MGAKTALILYANGDPAKALRGAPQPDRRRTRELVGRLYPSRIATPIEDGTLAERINPPDGIVYAAVFGDVTVVCAADLAERRRTDIPAQMIAEGAGRRMVFHSMHSVNDFVAFATWRPDGALERAFGASPRLGVFDEVGERLPFEVAYWAGVRPGEAHPLGLGEAALAALCGFALGGVPPEDPVDPYAVRLMGFRLRTPTVVLELSSGRPIGQPTPDEVEAHVRRLGRDLDYLILEWHDDNYLQVAVGDAYGAPPGGFRLERREGGPHAHYVCLVHDLDEVVAAFRAYVGDPQGRGSLDWQQMWV